MENTIFKGALLLFATVVFACDNKEKANENDQLLETDQTVTVKEDTAALKVTGKSDAEVEEKDMLISAYMNSQLQITLGEVAEEKASAEKVKEFGRAIAEENKEIQSHINDLAQASGIDIDPALTPEYAATLDTIQSLSGTEFDSAFIAIVIREHEDDIERFSQLSGSTDDPITRELIASTLEVLQRHQEQAEEVRDAIQN